MKTSSGIKQSPTSERAGWAGRRGLAATYTVSSISRVPLHLARLLVFRQMHGAPAITEQGAAVTGQRGGYGRLLCTVIGPRKWRTRWGYFLFLKIVEQSPCLDKQIELSTSQFFAMVHQCKRTLQYLKGHCQAKNLIRKSTN